MTRAHIEPFAAYIALFVVVAYVVCFPVTNTDIWWHLAAGRQMLDHGGWVFVDSLSWGAEGRAWTDVHWLFQLGAYVVHGLGGVRGLVIAKCLTAGMASLLILHAMGGPTDHHRTTLFGALCIALALYPARYLVLARPIVTTLVLLSATVFVLEQYCRRPRLRTLWWLIPIQLAWVNTQALFVLGPLTIGCYLVGQWASTCLAKHRFVGFSTQLCNADLVALAATLALVCVTCLVNPYGWDAIELPFSLFGRIDATGSALFSRNVSENIPMWVLARSDISKVVPFSLVAAMTFASFLLTLRAISLARLALLVAFFALAVMAYRNALLFCWIAGPVVGANAMVWIEHRVAPPRRRWWHATTAGVGLLGLVAIAAWHGWTSEESPIDRPAPFRVPTQTVAELRRLDIDGKLFNSVRYGGYLAWTCSPRWRPYIDGRLVLRGHDEFDAHLRMLDAPERFDAFRQTHDIKLALLPTSFPRRYGSLVRHLYASPDWALVYTDGTEALFVFDADAARTRLDLSTPQTVTAIVDDLSRRYAGQAAAHAQALGNLAGLLRNVGQPAHAITVDRVSGR